MIKYPASSLGPLNKNLLFYVIVKFAFHQTPNKELFMNAIEVFFVVQAGNGYIEIAFREVYPYVLKFLRQ